MLALVQQTLLVVLQLVVGVHCLVSASLLQVGQEVLAALVDLVTQQVVVLVVPDRVVGWAMAELVQPLVQCGPESGSLQL